MTLNIDYYPDECQNDSQIVGPPSILLCNFFFLFIEWEKECGHNPILLFQFLIWYMNAPRLVPLVVVTWKFRRGAQLEGNNFHNMETSNKYVTLNLCFSTYLLCAMLLHWEYLNFDRMMIHIFLYLKGYESLKLFSSTTNHETTILRIVILEGWPT